MEFDKLQYLFWKELTIDQQFTIMADLNILPKDINRNTKWLSYALDVAKARDMLPRLQLAMNQYIPIEYQETPDMPPKTLKQLAQQQANLHLEATFWQAWVAMNGERQNPYPDPACSFTGKQIGVDRYRFDFAWPDPYWVAVEIEGGIWGTTNDEGERIAGGHTRGGGYEKDCRKYNLAAARGWVVLRLAGQMITHDLPDHMMQLFEVLAYQKTVRHSMRLMARMIADQEAANIDPHKPNLLDFYKRYLGDQE